MIMHCHIHLIPWWNGDVADSRGQDGYMTKTVAILFILLLEVKNNIMTQRTSPLETFRKVHVSIYTHIIQCIQDAESK
jgi:hypothetical protein